MKLRLALVILSLSLPQTLRASDLWIEEYLDFPLYTTPSKLPQPPGTTIQNMHLGCATAAKDGTKLKACHELVDKLSEHTVLANEELKYLRMFSDMISSESRESILAQANKHIDEIKRLNGELKKGFPYVRFYISPVLRLAV